MVREKRYKLEVIIMLDYNVDLQKLEKYAMKIYIICMFANIINMLIWGGLAIFFEKWWLTLFSILFIQTPKNLVLKMTK